MKIKLNQELALRLVVEQKPVGARGGKITKTVLNSAPYLLPDNHPDSPMGVGVKVGKTKNLYDPASSSGKTFSSQSWRCWRLYFRKSANFGCSKQGNSGHFWLLTSPAKWSGEEIELRPGKTPNDGIPAEWFKQIVASTG